MSITFDAEDPRTLRALELTANAGQWLVCRTPDGQRGYGVPAAVGSARYYLVSPERCDCPQFGVDRPCVHVLAVRLHAELVRAVQRPEPPSRPRRRGHLRLVSSAGAAPSHAAG